MSPFRKASQRIREYDNLVQIGEIGRRYFVMNAYEGVLTIIGVLMGNLIAGVDDPRIVVSTGMATCIAMGVSGLWGACLTEAAERKRALVELGHHTLTDLGETRIGRASRVAVVAVALIDGFSPFLAALIVLIPFFAVGLFPSIISVYCTSLGIALLTLFGLGLFLGYISHGNLISYGVKTVVAGAISISISFLLGD